MRIVLAVALVVGAIALVWELLPAHAAPDGYSYFPTASTTDGKMLALVAMGNTSTLSGSTCTLNFSIPATQTAFTLGFFDGASNTVWDDNNGVCDTSYVLYADPGGLGQGTGVVQTWTDTDMAADSWQDFSVNNVPAAISPSGRYFYRLTVSTTNPTQTTINAFKVRVSGSSYVTPLNTFGYMGAVHPTITNTTTYDGSWDFYIRVAQGNTYFSLWDGDFDLSNANNAATPDTDDPNTPTTIPTWSTTAAIAEGANQGAPADDNNNTYTRSPSVYYRVVMPDGITSYTNTDPSGNREWEEFRLDTTTSDPAVTDHYVSEIPAGIWTVEARGVDLHNLNALRFEYPILGVDPDGLPVEPRFPYALGDRVWLDSDRDGVQDSAETSITGVVVSLRDGDGSLLATTTTDASGFYELTSLPGTYTVDINDPANYASGGALAGLIATTSRTQQAVITDANIATLDFGLASGPALVVNKSLSATQDATVTRGAEVDYTVTIENVGDTDATAFVVTDDIVGSAMEYVAGSTSVTAPGFSSSSDPTTPTSSEIVWDVGGGVDLASGDALTLTYTVRMKSGIPYGAYVDTVSVSAEDDTGFALAPDGSAWIAADTDPDDADDASVWVTVPALEVTKALSSADTTIQAGQTAQFEIVVRNAGDTRIETIPVSDVFDDDDLTYFTAFPLPDLASGGTLSWFDIGALDAGETTTLTVTFVADAAPAGNLTVDTAEVGPTVDIGGLAVPSDSATAAVAITNPSLQVTKSVSSGSTSVDPGDPVSFDVVVRNDGDTRIDSVSLDDVWSSGLVYSSATPLPNVSQATAYATATEDHGGSWTNTSNSLGAPDGASASSGNPDFDMWQSFSAPTDATTITAAGLTVRSRASGWGATVPGATGLTVVGNAAGDSAIGDWSIGGSAATRWQSIDDGATAHDGDATYIYGTGDNEYHASISAIAVPANALNIQVALVSTIRDPSNGGSNSWAKWSYGGVWQTGVVSRDPGTTYTNYTQTLANPAGGIWTPTAVGQIDGVGCDSSDRNPATRYTRIFIRVTYDLPDTINNDTWAIQYSTDSGSNWADIAAASTTSEGTLTDHSIDLSGILTPANLSDLTVRVFGETVGLPDGAGIVEWDSSALDLTYSDASSASTSLAWSDLGPLEPGEQTTVTVSFDASSTADGSLVNTATAAPTVDEFGDSVPATVDSAAVYVDGIAPVTSDDAPVPWQTTDTDVTLSVIEVGSPPAATYYRLNGGALTTYVSAVPVSTEGTNTLEYYSVDLAGNVEATQTATIRIDKSAPVTTISGLPSAPTSQTVTFSLDATDTVSGVFETYYSIDGGAATPYTVPVVLSAEATYTVEYWAVDVAGNIESAHSAVVVVDTVCAAVITTPANGYVTSSTVTPAVTFTGADTTSLTLNGVPFTLGDEISADGLYTLVAYASDAAGNTASDTVDFEIDTVCAAVITTPANGYVTSSTVTPAVTFTGADTTSLTLNGVPFTLGDEISADGLYTLVATASDAAGNTASDTVDFEIDTTCAAVITTPANGYVTSSTVTPAVTFTGADTTSLTLNGVPFTLGDEISADGLYTLVAYASDAAGNTASDTVDFEIDTVCAAVITTPANGYVTSSTVTPAVTFTGADTTSLTLNGVPFTLGDEISADGLYTLVAYASDAAGNTASDTVDFEIDTVCAAVITTPANGYVTSSTVTPAVTFTGADTTSLTLNGVPFTLGDEISADGLYTLVAYASDAAGNTASDTVDFEIDTVCAAVITTPADGLVTSSTVTPAVTFTGADTTSLTLNGVPFTLGDEISADGLYTLVAYASDAAGNTASDTVDFEIDTTCAAVITTPADGLVTSSTVTPAVTFTGADTTSLTLNGVPFTLGDEISADGLYTLVATASDAAGNTASDTVDFEIDTTCAAVITTPADGLVTSSTVTPAVTFTGADTTSLTLNGVPFTLGDEISADGLYTLVAYASDAAGNTATDSVSFEIDTVCAAVITTPANGYVTSSTVTPAVTFTGADTTSLTLNGVPFTLGDEISADGLYTLVAYASDAAGNTATDTVDFEIDTVCAAVITTPANGYVTSSTVTPAVTFTGADTTSLTLNGVPFTLGDEISADGVYTLVAYASDAAGNTASDTVDFEIDTVCAAVITTPANGYVTSSTVTPAVTFTGADTTSLTLNGVPFTLGDEISADGLYTLVAYASDAAGNTATDSVSFEIDTVCAAVITTPANGYVTSSTVTPAVTFTGADTTSLTLNGVPFTLGDEISADGLYTLVAYASDAAGNTATDSVSFEIISGGTTTLDVTIGGVVDGGTYPNTVTPTVTSTNASATITATLNGDPYEPGTPITTPGTYTLVATATDIHGNEATDTVTFTVTDATSPAAPLNLKAAADTDSIVVTWNAVTVPDLAGYRIYRALSATGPFTQIGTTPAGTTTLTDTKVDAKVMYYYRAIAYDTTGNSSANSNVASAMISPDVTRLWGANRLLTAIDISSETFPSADVVIIATSRDFADALSASGLAGSYRAPLLLTDPNNMAPQTQAEIQRLGSKRALIVGGPAAVAPGVATALANMGLKVDRYGGPTRYETSVLIAQAIEAHELSLGRPFTKQVFLARGDNFPDALSVSPLAYSLKAPILLTKPTSLPGAVRNYVRAEDFAYQLVAGGTAAVADAVANDMATAGSMASTRKGGADRYKTSALVADYGVSKGWGAWKAVGTATGKNFPDALTGGVAMGEMGGVLMVTTPDKLHSDIRKRFVDNKPAIFKVRLFGGTVALSENVANEIKTILK